MSVWPAPTIREHEYYLLLDGRLSDLGPGDEDLPGTTLTLERLLEAADAVWSERTASPEVKP